MFLQMYKNWESSGAFARGIAAVSLMGYAGGRKAARIPQLNFERKARCPTRAQINRPKNEVPAYLRKFIMAITVQMIVPLSNRLKTTRGFCWARTAPLKHMQLATTKNSCTICTREFPLYNTLIAATDPRMLRPKTESVVKPI